MSPELVELSKRRYRVGLKETDHFQIVNIDTNRRLASVFKVVSVPTYVVIEQGRELTRVVGNQSADLMENLYVGIKLSSAPKFKSNPKAYNGVRHRWTWPGGTEGSLRLHLMREHGTTTNGLSFEECRNLHDYFHNISLMNSRR